MAVGTLPPFLEMSGGSTIRFNQFYRCVAGFTTHLLTPQLNANGMSATLNSTTTNTMNVTTINRVWFIIGLKRPSIAVLV
jgi:hypothetical protein